MALPGLLNCFSLLLSLMPPLPVLRNWNDARELIRNFDFLMLNNVNGRNFMNAHRQLQAFLLARPARDDGLQDTTRLAMLNSWSIRLVEMLWNMMTVDELRVTLRLACAFEMHPMYAPLLVHRFMAMGQQIDSYTLAILLDTLENSLLFPGFDERFTEWMNVLRAFRQSGVVDLRGLLVARNGAGRPLPFGPHVRGFMDDWRQELEMFRN